MSLSEDDILIDACSALNIDDVVGSRVDNVDDASTSSVVLEIYPLVNNRRTRRTERITFPSNKDAQQFHSVVQRNIRRRLPPHLLNKEANNRVLVLINPFSGQKRAEKLWIEHGAPVLDAAGIESDVVHTGTSEHTPVARDFSISPLSFM
ncbi:unnamed protein product [Nippostrongylus brasiliensis]|uniref:DAGKc domain-containing protein n=1 Tax=Nippostrongylus brasiliensis TaxID=27835 RepID=A0A0N4XL59_NIPBR|nr:unnamed protein product [Nippostrongylus brasiliensis]